MGIKGLNIAKDGHEIWNQDHRNQLSESIKRFEKPYHKQVTIFPEAVSNCIDCEPKSMVVYPNGEIFDLCQLCAVCLTDSSDLLESVTYLGRLGETNQFLMDVVKKKEMICNRICPTLSYH